MVRSDSAVRFCAFERTYSAKTFTRRWLRCFSFFVEVHLQSSQSHRKIRSWIPLRTGNLHPVWLQLIFIPPLTIQPPSHKNAFHRSTAKRLFEQNTVTVTICYGLKWKTPTLKLISGWLSFSQSITYISHGKTEKGAFVYLGQIQISRPSSRHFSTLV